MMLRRPKKSSKSKRNGSRHHRAHLHKKNAQKHRKYHESNNKKSPKLDITIAAHNINNIKNIKDIYENEGQFQLEYLDDDIEFHTDTQIEGNVMFYDNNVNTQTDEGHDEKAIEYNKHINNDNNIYNNNN
eukprot:158123_1